MTFDGGKERRCPVVKSLERTGGQRNVGRKAVYVMDERDFAQLSFGGIAADGFSAFRGAVPDMDIGRVYEAAHGFTGKYRVVGHRRVEGDGKLDLRMVFSDCAE
jgi:hypothetical protein